MSKKSIFKIVLLVAFSVLLIISSYAWFQDKSNPQISVSDIKVSAAEGLVIKLDPDSAGRKTVDLNSILDSFDEFELRQVSSVDATNFYTIDFKRMIAMQQATTNGEKLVSELETKYNHLRQESITSELLDANTAKLGIISMSESGGGSE